MDWKRILIGRWSWKRPFYSLIGIYLLLVLISCCYADKLIFFPPAASYDGGMPDLVRISSDQDKNLAAVYLPARDGMPTLLYSHGNAEDLGQSTDLYDRWHAMGFGVLAYDYPGYGLSDGRPTEASCYRSAEAAWGFLKTKGISAESIVVVGRSVGSGPGTWIASQKHPAGLVLISPFTSAFAVRIPWPVLPGDRFKNLGLIKEMKTPLLVIHGEEDKVISVSHGRKLVEASAAEDKTFYPIQGAGHNDLMLVAEDEIIAQVADFARRVAR